MQCGSSEEARSQNAIKVTGYVFPRFVWERVLGRAPIKISKTCSRALCISLYNNLNPRLVLFTQNKQSLKLVIVAHTKKCIVYIYECCECLPMQYGDGSDQVPAP